MRCRVLRGGVLVISLAGLLCAAAACSGGQPAPGGGPTLPTAPSGPIVVPPPAPTPALPAPTGLAVTKATYTTLALRWRAPAGAVRPADYQVLLNGSLVATVPPGVTSYAATGLAPGTDYSIAIQADFGNTGQAVSPSLAGRTVAAALSGDAPVNLKVLAAPSGDSTYHVGDALTEDWNFTAECSATWCSLAAGASLQSQSFTIPLHADGAGYAGSTKAKLAECMFDRKTPADTLTLTLTPARDGVANGAWLRWSGTLVDSAPEYAPNGGGLHYCPAHSRTFAVTPQAVPTVAQTPTASS
jgi:hypothetical protein